MTYKRMEISRGSLIFFFCMLTIKLTCIFLAHQVPKLPQIIEAVLIVFDCFESQI